jgi:hydroxyacylglutathione hydrolase
LIDALAQMAVRERGAGSSRHQRLRDGVESIIFDEASRNRWRLSEAAIRAVFGVDIELNAQGLGAWLDSTA